MVKRFLCILLCLFPAVALAAPSISGISGTYAHGSTVTIGGSGFGTKSSAAPNLFDRVDSITGATAYPSITDGGSINTGGGYPWGDHGDEIYFETGSSEQRHTRSTANYKAASGTSDGHYLKSVESRQIEGTSYLYYSWWVKTSVAMNSAYGGSNKWTRAGYGMSFPSAGNFSWTAGQAYYNQASGDGCSNESLHEWESWTEANTWTFFQIYFNNVSKDYYCYVNNELREWGNWANGGCPSVDSVRSIGWDGNGGGSAAFNLWLDDIYVDSTPQRVMIGNADTYSECTAFEMQPATSWSNTSIQITLNQGAYADSSTRWIYVVDSSNTANATGTAITFGSSEEDTTPPTVTSATINSEGTTLTLAMSESVTNNYTSTVPTLSMSGGSVTASCNSCSSGTSLTYTLSRTVYSDETGTYDWNVSTNYVEDASGNDLIAIDDAPITNSSTQESSPSTPSITGVMTGIRR